MSVREAREAARAGDLAKAERLLADQDSMAALDLLARVHAQSGKLTEADQCWAKVQEVSPDNAAAADGRRVIKEIQEGRRRPRPTVTAGRLTAAAFVAVCAVLAGSAAVLTPEPTPTANTELEQETRQLRERLAATEKERADAARQHKAALSTIAAALTMPGTKVETRDKDVRIVFDEGLFAPNATTVTAQGERQLIELGHRLSTLGVRTTVVGHAATVPGGPTTGGEPIALDRAQSAAEQLAKGGNLPLTAFTLTTANQSEGPFPDAARNRTVTLLVAPADQ